MDAEKLRDLERTTRYYAEAGVDMTINPDTVMDLINAYEKLATQERVHYSSN